MRDILRVAPEKSFEESKETRPRKEAVQRVKEVLTKAREERSSEDVAKVAKERGGIYCAPHSFLLPGPLTA